MNKKIYIIVFILILLIIVQPSYYFFLPTVPIYPDNYAESKLVEYYVNNRTRNDVEFFYKTNKSVSPAFLPYVLDEDLSQLEDIITSQNYFIFFLKCAINRARPMQVNKNIKPIDISTAQTPAYPAGHAFQAYYLAKILSKKYPERKHIFDHIAEQCNLSRIKAGLHYPSDGEFAKKIVDLY